MINMKVKNYIIKSDDNNVTVYKQSLDENGKVKLDKNGEKELLSLVGYYASLKGALRGIKKNYVFSNETDITDLVEYENKLNEITEAFNDKLKLSDL